jgi:uncharacterized protein (DUF58 family)
MPKALPDSTTNPAGRASSSAAARAARFIDPQVVMRIKNLQLRARAVVEGFYAGIHRSPYHGFSVEFSEYRAYTPGDDPRYLDWKLFARTDRYCIKRFEEETNLLCYVLLDLSQSMAYGAGEFTKTDYARTLAASLAYFLFTQRDAVGLLTFDESIREFLLPRHRPGHLRRIMLTLERETGGRSTVLAKPLEQIADSVRKRGLVVLISDLLAPVDDLQTNLGYLRSRGHDVVVLRVLDRAEIDFPFASPGMFHDLESGRTLYIDPSSARAEYKRRFAEHALRLRETCSNLGVDMAQLTTDRPLELALFDLLHARMRRGRRALRRVARRRRAPA